MLNDDLTGACFGPIVVGILGSEPVVTILC